MTYRNYRELTDEEIRQLEELYPVTTNRELSRRFGISVDAWASHTNRKNAPILTYQGIQMVIYFFEI